jgi:hypothetical protein
MLGYKLIFCYKIENSGKEPSGKKECRDLSSEYKMNVYRGGCPFYKLVRFLHNNSSINMDDGLRMAKFVILL